MTEAERAYRRGVYQTIHRISKAAHDLDSLNELPKWFWELIGDMERGSMRARDSVDPRYLGQYLDVLLQECVELPPGSQSSPNGRRM
jgi:hypothetical protein